VQLVVGVIFGAVAAALLHRWVRNTSVRALQNRRAKASVFIVLVTFAIGYHVAGMNFGSSNTNKPRNAAWAARIDSFAVLPGAGNYVRVYAQVSNTGTAPGGPQCVISIQPANAYGDPVGGNGIDGLSGNKVVQPGHTYRFYDDIVVPDSNADLVTAKSMISISNC
jgi:hypothetical protein